MQFSVFISCAKGLEYLLESEVKALGLHITRVSPQGVYGEASLAVIYQLCLWSRIANRVQLILFSGNAHNEQTLYQLCHQFAWQTVFSADKTLAVLFHGMSTQIRNTLFGAQVVKDAVVDHFRDLQGTRPSVDRENPDVLIHAYLKNDELTVSLDLTGYSLHQRGYRKQAGEAPLKENLASAMLIRANWLQLVQEGYALHDPFCGSGTVVIEAAMMAARIAPGSLRHDQSFVHWAHHQPALWEKIRQDALSQVQPVSVPIVGTDADARQIALAQANAKRAGVDTIVEFKPLDLNACQAMQATGLVICNPPYGERLDDMPTLIPLYQTLGQQLHSHYLGWQAAILTSNPLLAKAIGLRASKQYALYNGPIACTLYCMSINQENQLRGAQTDQARMFANRLEKNVRHLEKWAQRQGIQCYRVYDADMPDYAFAIDRYADYAIIQEYAAPKHIPLHKVEKRHMDVLSTVPGILGIPASHLIIKQRKQQKGVAQYQKLNDKQSTIVIKEGQARYKINLHDYLDTGLFLDHRKLRLRFAELPKDTHFLNCFCYTGTASVQAALSGSWTTNVDMSNTYLQWAQENFQLNDLPLGRHQFIREDCLTWLGKTRDHFDVIFLDPPSFSNSKKMEGTLDIQRDHVDLIQAAMRVLNPEGVLYFSTNLRHFKLAEELSTYFNVQDITKDTLDEDFKRNQRIHHCFVIKAKS